MYNKLPTEIVNNATTFDLMVLDVYTTWQKFKENPEDPDQYESGSLEKILKDSRV